MTAGTVVITGGILATVILLCIVAVLCYCRLQYYCCKKDDSEDEEESDIAAQPHFACNACAMHAVDGPTNQLTLPLEPNHSAPRNYCPTCSPYSSPFYIRTTEEMRNGGERITYTPTRYKDPGVSIKLSNLQGFPVSQHGTAQDIFPNTRAISTEV
ncbi:protein FAM163A [Latimeria chalumnae]|uniref:Family with sequence similarity 163 member A n=1 Tax=Latimeria chalumnae TaxID=7897 RepID=H3A6F3_LATCH|nr:PREDICTED: protein FAM163A [Latimeria chalumnae]|eukprot:XP_006012835.1 PREDICTED: protein FAM163A [Latimeria chalumnae]